MTDTVRFDEAYYQRYYLRPSTRVYSKARHARLVSGVMGMTEWLLGEVRSVLDVGAGVGWWRQWLKKHRPEVDCVSTELEPAICKKYGHQQADVRQLKMPRTFDLVVCHGVLPYLAANDLKPAIDNLGAVCGGVMYLEAICNEDFAGSVDETLTDTSVHRHPAALYRKHLGRHFTQLGAGLWAAKRADVVLFSLEAAPRQSRA